MLFFLRNLSAALQLCRSRWASGAMDRRQRWALNCALSLGLSTKSGRSVLEGCFLSLKKKKAIHHGPKGTVIFFSVHCCLRGQRYSMILSSNPCMCRSTRQRFSKCIYTAAGVEIDKYLAAAQELKLLGYFPFSLSLWGFFFFPFSLQFFPATISQGLSQIDADVSLALTVHLWADLKWDNPVWLTCTSLFWRTTRFLHPWRN